MTNHSELVNLHNDSSAQKVSIVNGLDKIKPPKPLGERRKAVLRQELMVLLGNTCVVASGMSVALPSVSLAQLTDPNDIYHLNTEESSWFVSLDAEDNAPNFAPTASCASWKMDSTSHLYHRGSRTSTDYGKPR
uniref:Uncharacterized protein n=1 Tax=Bactrocera latifrons TaxID=174628 RepID=A0A0K8WEF3_BACLA